MAGNPFKKYGLTLEGYNRLSAAQNGLCKICNQPPRPRKRLVVDHDHKTGAVRGLLCNHCNSGIGFFRDNTAWLSSAITYLDAADVIAPKSAGFDISEFLVINQNRVKSFGIDEHGKLTAATFFPESVKLEEQEPAVTRATAADKPIPEAPLNDADMVLDIPKGMLVPQPLTEDSN